MIASATSPTSDATLRTSAPVRSSLGDAVSREEPGAAEQPRYEMDAELIQSARRACCAELAPCTPIHVWPAADRACVTGVFDAVGHALLRESGTGVTLGPA